MIISHSPLIDEFIHRSIPTRSSNPLADEKSSATEKRNPVSSKKLKSFGLTSKKSTEGANGRARSSTADDPALLHVLDEIIGGLSRNDYQSDTLRPVAVLSHMTVSQNSGLLSRMGYNWKVLNLSAATRVTWYEIYHKNPSVARQTLSFCRAILEVLLDHCQDKILSMSNWVDSFFTLYDRCMSWPLEDFVKNAKFFTVWPMAHFLRNDPPPPPPKSYGEIGTVGSRLLFSGAIKRFLKNRLNSKRTTDLSLFLGFLQGVKRACEPVPESYVQKSYESHRLALTRERTVSDSSRIQIIQYLDRFWKGVKLVSDKLTEPSTSASYGTKRSTGGARGLIKDTILGNLPHSQLSSMVEVRPGDIREIRSYENPRTYSELYTHLPFEASKVEVHAVLEPLKVRLITKGSTFAMWFSRRLQKTAWSHLQTIPAFALTGHPLSEEDLRQLRVREENIQLPESFNTWVSGDYSAATDNLKIQYTKDSNEALMSYLPLSEQTKEVYRSVLYEQEIHYPRTSKLTPVQQTTGQLMGSILSFPHLCSLNLVAYWMTLEKVLQRKVPLMDLPVLVNGDDILFRTNPEFYKLWLENIHEIGFELSLGKNYVHENYLMINSESYWYDEGFFNHIKYLNVGLLTGQAKLTGRLELRMAPIWDYYNKTMSGASNKLRCHKRFLKLNRSLIDQFTKKGTYNLFIDQYFGGLGFDLYPEVKPYLKMTRFQRKFGHYLKGQVENYSGVLSQLKSQMGIVSTSEGSVKQVNRYHYGRYHLEPFHREGPIGRSHYSLVLGPQERVPEDLSLQVPLLMGENLETTLKVVHPKSSVLRDFRSKDNWLGSKKQLLSLPRLYVEELPDVYTS
jgi:hypothetical protein